MLRFLSLVVAATLVAGTASATDGAVEISQACVTAGCFPGDTPGFPVTISAPGNYRLTSNLRASVAFGAGQDFPLIEITGPDVSLDLGDFSLSCIQLALPASPRSDDATTGGRGVFAKPTAAGAKVRNGTIRGMADDGMFLQLDSVADGVRAVDNAGDGIHVSTGVVRGCVASKNGERGISVSGDSVVVENFSSENGQDGFLVGPGSVVARNASSDNAGDGFELGIDGGFTTVSGGLAADNAARGNAGLGMSLENVWGYKGNSLTNNNGDNAIPQVSTFGINLGQNVCGSNTTCP